MITLKIINTISPVCEVKNSNRDFISKWQTDNFGAVFVNENENSTACLFKKKLTLKHLKTVRSSEPRVRLLSQIYIWESQGINFFLRG